MNMHRRLVIDVWTAEQAKAAAEVAKAYDGETLIRWAQPSVDPFIPDLNIATIRLT